MTMAYDFGRRQKFRINLSGLQNNLSIAREKFEKGNFLEAFDIYEQLVAAYPKQSVELLAEVYDCYQRFPYKDRYNLYQARQFDFGIKPSDKVLDIGSGHNPFPLATHLADIALEDHKYGRAGVPFKHIQGKPVFECSVESTPFKDREFDFVYCSHVLEHCREPEKACRELMRIAKRGYIETPSKGKDIFLNSTKVSNHTLWVEAFNSSLIFTEYTPEEIEGFECNILMDMNCAPQTIREKAFAALMNLKPYLINTMFLWEDKFEYEVRRLAPRITPLSQPSIQKNTSERVETSVLRFLQIHTFYAHYLEGYYKANPSLASLSFKEQIDALIRDGYGAVHIFPPYMDSVGYEAQFVIANNPYSQQQWLNENHVDLDRDKDWLYETARHQVETFKPDVLYLSDPVTFDSRFVRSLSWKPSLIIGWKASNIPTGTDWSEFDVMLSNLSSLRDMSLKLGAKAAENFFPGFPIVIKEMIRGVQPEFDLVFSGQWTLVQHPRRNYYLSEIAKAASRPDKAFSCGYYLSGQVDKIPPEVAKYNIGGRFGMPMYHALRSGRIAFDARGILEIRDPSNQKTIDLAAKETANMRVFEATGSGVFLLTEYFENLKQYFEPGKEIETFRDEKELIDKIDYYLAHPEEREAIARRGQERCLRDYSMENRAGAFDEIIRKHLALKSAPPHTPEVSQSPIEKIVRQAVNELNANHNAEALALLEQAVVINPAISDINYGKAVALARLGRMDEAIETLNPLLSAEPNNEKARTLFNEIAAASVLNHVKQAAESLNANKNDEAFALLNKAKSLRKSLQGLDYLRAICFLRMDQPDAAREALREELRYFPDNEQAKNLMTQILERHPQMKMISGSVGDSEFQELLKMIRPYTMSSEQRLFSLFSLAKRVCSEGIPGNFIECGVAAGGSTALLAAAIKRYSRHPRWLYAFDSFEGMPEPTQEDRHRGMAAEVTGWGTGTCAAPEDSVKEICAKLGVSDIVKPVKGYFENTLPVMRDKAGMIALLHMDGDWYESTKAILHNLYDHVVNDGFIQVDDYGYWQGCQKAVHEFESLRNLRFEINQIDGTGVWLRKPDKFPVNASVSASLAEGFQHIDPSRKGVESQMSQNERFQLYYAVRELLPAKASPLRFVEIGSWAGASLLLIYAAIKQRTPNIQGFSIEPGGQPQFYQVIEQLKNEVSHLRMFSHQAAPQLKQFFEKDGIFPEFIFIDGSHVYEDVRRDIIDYFPLLAPGGIMVFHDYLPPLNDENREAILFHHGGKEPGIRQACQELMEDTYHCEVIDIPLLYPTDPTQTQAHLPIIPGVFSTIRAYRKK